MRASLPPPVPLVPGEQLVGEAVIAPARHLPDAGQADQPAEPAAARRHRPDRDRHIGADQQAALIIHHVQRVADLVDASVDFLRRVRRRGDVAPLDSVAAAGRRAIHRGALLFDAGAADRTGGVVIELRLGCHSDSA